VTLLMPTLDSIHMKHLLDTDVDPYPQYLLPSCPLQWHSNNVTGLGDNFWNLKFYKIRPWTFDSKKFKRFVWAYFSTLEAVFERKLGAKKSIKVYAIQNYAHINILFTKKKNLFSLHVVNKAMKNFSKYRWPSLFIVLIFVVLKNRINVENVLFLANTRLKIVVLVFEVEDLSGT